MIEKSGAVVCAAQVKPRKTPAPAIKQKARTFANMHVRKRRKKEMARHIGNYELLNHIVPRSSKNQLTEKRIFFVADSQSR